MNVAIEGCLHGQLDEVYYQLRLLEEKSKIKLDLLLICGDFQSLRDEQDLDDMHCPPKYKQMGSFVDYFTGKKKAPLLTIFIGGNHEAVNHLRELYFGGWVAENIYYLGQAGSIFVTKGSVKLRISGCSGIYNHHDFKYSTKTENCPLRGRDKVSAYHLKQLEVYRMQMLARIHQLRKQDSKTYGTEDHEFDIFMSHDWPKNIALYGDIHELYRYKSFLKKQIDEGTFGSPPMERLLQLMKPSFWFSAHMHIKYPALFPHPNNKFTHFLSLDKCLSKRLCIQALKFGDAKSICNNEAPTIQIDQTWLAIVYMTRGLQLEEANLYYYDKMELKLRDTKGMNQYLTDFPSVFQKVIRNDKVYMFKDFDVNQEQIEQTRLLLEQISIQARQFKGVIFPKSNFYVEKPPQTQQGHDEIQLQL